MIVEMAHTLQLIKFTYCYNRYLEVTMQEVNIAYFVKLYYIINMLIPYHNIVKQCVFNMWALRI